MYSDFEHYTLGMFIITLEKILELRQQNSKLLISREEIKKMEENELFAFATKEGFSKETIRKMFVPVLDYMIENLNLERFEHSLTKAFLKSSHNVIDLSSITGASIFDYCDTRGHVEKLCTPEYKKKMVFCTACKLVVEQRNISFNLAIKRTISKLQSESFIISEIEDNKKEISALLYIINPLIDFYLENEVHFILRFLKK